jgi:cell division protein FtsN
VAAGIRQQAAGKDIARTVAGDGTVRYVVGPFADKAKAEDLALFVKAMGVTDVVCGVIKK